MKSILFRPPPHPFSTLIHAQFLWLFLALFCIFVFTFSFLCCTYWLVHASGKWQVAACQRFRLKFKKQSYSCPNLSQRIIKVFLARQLLAPVPVSVAIRPPFLPFPCPPLPTLRVQLRVSQPRTFGLLERVHGAYACVRRHLLIRSVSLEPNEVTCGCC